jgi:hypothetical protein
VVEEKTPNMRQGLKLQSKSAITSENFFILYFFVKIFYCILPEEKSLNLYSPRRLWESEMQNIGYREAFMSHINQHFVAWKTKRPDVPG